MKNSWEVKVTITNPEKLNGEISFIHISFMHLKQKNKLIPHPFLNFLYPA